MNEEKTFNQKITFLIAFTGFFFFIERILISPSSWNLISILSGILGSGYLITSWYYFAKDNDKLLAYSTKQKVSTKHKIFSLLKIMTILFINSILSISIYFLPVYFFGMEHSKSKIFFIDNMILSNIHLTFFEFSKDMFWCSLFCSIMWIIKSQIINKIGFKIQTILNVFLVTLLFPIILLPMMVYTVYKNHQDILLMVHITYQVIYFFIAYIIFLVFIKSRPVITLLSLESIGNLLLENFSFGLSYRNIDDDVDKSHMDAMYAIFTEIYKSEMPKKILDAGGGKGGFIKYLYEIKSALPEVYVILEKRRDAVNNANELFNTKNWNNYKAYECDIVKDISKISKIVTEKFDLVIIHQTIQYLNPHQKEHIHLFSQLINLLSDNGKVLVIDEFPQQAPFPTAEINEENSIKMIKRANVLIPIFSVRKEDIIEWAESSGFTLCQKTETEIKLETSSSSYYHPPITGLLFEKKVKSE